MRTPKIRRAVARSAAAVRDTTSRFQRPTTTAIQCGHCGKWVKPRRYDPLLYACLTCAPGVAHEHYQIQRDATLTAEANRRAYEKELHAWRRQLASVVR